VAPAVFSSNSTTYKEPAGKFMFKYGTVSNLDAELWTAFWIMGFNVNEVGWPDAAEIDIFEMGQSLAVSEGKVNQRVVSAAHCEFNDTYATYTGWKDAACNLTGNFHSYKFECTKDYHRTYFDTTMVWEMIISEEFCTDCTSSTSSS
jgi:beta-glucanase (GH16 family)